MRTIGFIGAGNMATALLQGLLRAGQVSPDHIVASDVRPERLVELGKAHGVRTTSDNVALLGDCDVIVLAVKPQVIDSVLEELGMRVRSEQIIVSIAAGVPLSHIEARMAPGSRVIRAMPNTPALVQAGATALAPGRCASADDVVVARAMFEAVGRVVVLGEAQLDAVTGLSGSGPAFVLLMIEAMADGGVKVGLPRDVAQILAAQTVFGAAKLLVETGEHPARLKDMVTSPGGTTIAGVHALESRGVRSAFMDAIEVATRRSAELGRALIDEGRRSPSPSSLPSAKASTSS
jgi:pyrroline-5-carboxylate reductase